MKKKSMTASPVEYKPPTTLQVSREMVKDVSVGENITVKVTGKVTSVRSNESEHDETNEIQLENAKVTEISSNKANRELKKMMEKD